MRKKKKKKKKRQHLPQPRIQQFHSHLMERKTGMFTHKNSGINLKLKKKRRKDSQYRVVLGLLLYKWVFFDGDFVAKGKDSTCSRLRSPTTV